MSLSTVVTCPDPPPSLTNGEFTLSSSNIVGSIATYTCNNGYRFNTTATSRTCQLNEIWSMEDVQCEKGLIIIFTCMKWFNKCSFTFFMCVVPEDNDKLSGGAIAGIVIGSVVILVVLAVLAVILVVLLWMRYDSRSGKYNMEGMYFLHDLGEKC